MITIRYFASLRETLGRSTEQLEIFEPHTVLSIWQLANPDLALPENTLTAVNMDYVPHSHLVKNGDEVAFFPPVTGG
jgi:molybdopterin synthase sulfur carrier subunit